MSEQMVEQNESIFSLLPKVAEAVGAIGKERRNHGQGYNYRGIEDVLNACHPALCKYGVTVLPIVMEYKREERQSKGGSTCIHVVLKTQYQFIAPDGSMVSAIIMSEGMDTGDKAINKALSAGLKYALGQVLSIPFDLVDSEDDRFEHSSAARKSSEPDREQKQEPAGKSESTLQQPKSERAKQMAEIARFAQEMGHDKGEMLRNIGAICRLPQPPLSGKELSDQQIAAAYREYKAMYDFYIACENDEGSTEG